MYVFNLCIYIHIGTTCWQVVTPRVPAVLGVGDQCTQPELLHGGMAWENHS